MEQNLAIAKIEGRSPITVIRVGASETILKHQSPGREATYRIPESDVYTLLREVLPHGSDPWLPVVRIIPQQESILIFESTEQWAPIKQFTCGDQFPIESCARTIGEILGKLHSVELTESLRSTLPTDVPAILNLASPSTKLLSHGTSMDLEFTRRVQANPLLIHHLQRIKADWALDCLIHGDLRWSNLLVRGTADWLDESNVQLIDWELAQLGNPAWDLGSAAAAILLEHATRSSEIPGLASPPDGIRALLDGYLAVCSASIDHLVRDMTRHAGARMIQYALEAAVTEGTLEHPNVTKFLDLALWALVSPEWTTGP